jgi:hypothetical protein
MNDFMFEYYWNDALHWLNHLDYCARTGDHPIYVAHAVIAFDDACDRLFNGVLGNKSYIQL